MKIFFSCLAFLTLTTEVCADLQYHYGLNINQAYYDKLISDYGFGVNAGARLTMSDSPLFLAADITPQLERFHRWDEDKWEYKILGFDNVALSAPVRFSVGMQPTNVPVSLAFFVGVSPEIGKNFYSAYYSYGSMFLGPSLSLTTENGMRLEIAAAYEVRGLFYFDDGVNLWPWSDNYEFDLNSEYRVLMMNLVMLR